MNPVPLKEGDVVQPDMAVIMVGVSGTSTVGYLQFTHSSMPAINVRFPPKGNAIVAVAVPVGLKQLYLNTITLGGREGGYTASGTAFGYIGVRMPNGTRTPKLDLSKPGLYYVATLDTNAPGQFQVSPIDAQLQAFRQGFKSTVGNLEPVNFQWPQ